MNPEGHEEDLDSPVERGASSAASSTGVGVGFSPCGATGPKRPFVDRVENAALKGRSSTAQEMSEEPEDCVFIEGHVLCL